MPSWLDQLVFLPLLAVGAQGHMRLSVAAPKIEHRLFSVISHSRRGKPLIDYATIISLPEA